MAQSSIVVNVFENIVKPESDDRLYRGIELENGMKILLVSDSKTDKSAASVNVNAGFLMDSIPGLAHFCEHMLFLGSKKYPSENAYNKFIRDHSGFCNAFTNDENTVYYFDIANNHLKEALDIFAQFFVAPLFDPDSTYREINAVNSENDRNLNSDYWRVDQFKRSLCLDKHPYSGFGGGSTTTLKTEPEAKGINIRDELLKFHTKYYSANRMTACIYGGESLDKLQEYAVNMFSTIQNKNLSKIKFDSKVFKENSLKCIHYVVPIEDLHELNLLFQIPDLRDHYESNPIHYVTYLMKNKDPGSLISHLKNKCWCNSLYTTIKDEANGINFFDITFELTDEGIDHLTEIIELFFQYMNLLRDSGVQNWIHNEIVDLGKIKFRFKDRMSPIESVLNWSLQVQKYKFNDVLFANHYETKYEPHLIEEIIKQLNPELMVAVAISKKYEGTTNKAEKWYGTQYRSDPVTMEQLKKWQNCGLNTAFKLPEANKFIPNDFSLIKHTDGVSKFPVVLKETALMRIWYKGDDKFLLPKAYLNIALRSPLSRISPKNANMTELFIKLVNDSLDEFTYSIEMAGLYYYLQRTNYGIKLSFSGFNNKLDHLLEIVLKCMFTLKIDEKRFAVLLEKYKKHLENYQSEQPHEHATENMELLLIDSIWSNEEVLEAIDSFTVNDLKSFISSLLTDGIFIEALMYGNITKENTIKMMETFQTYLQNSTTTSLTPLHKSKQYNSRYVKLPNQCDMVYLYNNKIHPTIGIEAYYQCEKNDIRNNVLLDLCCQIVSESAFSVLRTEEQLGYVVICSVKRYMLLPGIKFLIQSDKNPTYLDERIENFIMKTGETLKNMKDEEFKIYVEALKVNKLEEPKEICIQRDKYWFEIIEHKTMFDRANIEVAYLNTVTKSDFIDFYMKILSPSSQTRKKLAVYVTPVSMNAEVEEKIKDKKIKDVTTFKATMELCPLPQPYTQV